MSSFRSKKTKNGGIRFLAASFIVLWHSGLFTDFLLGIFFATFFFVFSGLSAYYFTQKGDNFWHFLTTRIFRIYPMYFVVIIGSILVRLVSGNVGELSLGNILFNLALLPINFISDLRMTNGSGLSVLVASSWYLAIMMQYNLIYYFLRKNAKLLFIIFCASFVMFVLGSVGVVNREMTTYRTLAGTLFIFLSGHYIGKAVSAGHEQQLYYKSLLTNLIRALIGLWLVILCFDQKILFSSVNEIILGVIFAIPLTYIIEVGMNKDVVLNQWLGKISYPLLLFHSLVIDIFIYIKTDSIISKETMAILILFGSIILAELLERYVDRLVTHVKRHWVERRLVSS